MLIERFLKYKLLLTGGQKGWIMEINLTPVLSSEGSKMPIDTALLPVQYEGDGFSFAAPVQVQGEANNTGGSIILRLHIAAVLSANCARCGKEVEQELTFDCEERLEKGVPGQENENESDDPDIIYFSGYSIELDELVYRNVFMNFPTKILCQEDCKGLCPNCGQDLNEGSCGCDRQTTDPRFDVLDNLL